MTLLQDFHEVCLCVPYDSPEGCPRSVFVFHLTFLQDIHKVCSCIPPDSPAECLQNVFMCSIVFHVTILQDVHKVCLCVPYDSPTIFVFFITLTTYSHHFRTQNSPTVFVKGKCCFFYKVPYGCLYVIYIYSKLQNVREDTYWVRLPFCLCCNIS